MTFRTIIGSAAATLLWFTPAHADIAPPEGYVETCTIELQLEKGLLCEPCATNRTEPNACAAKFGPQGLTKTCSRGGATTWTELWCKPAPAVPEAPKPAVPEVPKPALPEAPKVPDAPKADLPPAPATTATSKGCASGDAGVAAGLLSLLALAVFRRQRRV